MSTAGPESEPFIQRQYAFAAYIRDPGKNPLPEGVEKRRMDLYRELFLNNIDSFLSNSFPVLRRILSEGQWVALLRDFFARHRAGTPYFAKIPEEFLDYLQNERGSFPEDPPFLLELAHYEWIELALSIAEGEAPGPQALLQEDPLPRKFRLSDLAWPLAYRFPVHRISPDFQPRTTPEQATYLVVYRNAQDQVRFLEINSVTYRLLELMQVGEPRPIQERLLQIAAELQHRQPDSVFAGGRHIVRQLCERGLLWCAD